MPETNPQHSNLHGPLHGIGFAVLGFALFASHDAIIKALGSHYSVFQIIFFVTLFAFVPMSLMILADRAVNNFRPKHPGLILTRSALMIGSMSCAFYAFSTLPLTEVYGLLFATPLLITAFSVPLLGETVRMQRWAAVIIGLFGVLIILRPGITVLAPGHFAALGAAICSSLASIVVRKIGARERSAVLILYPMLLSMSAMGAILPAVYKPIALEHLGLLAVLGILSVVAQICTIKAYRAAAAALVAPVQYTQIIWASIFGYFFFAEKPDTHVALGAAIIIGSGIFIVWREARQNVSTRRPLLKNPNFRFDTGPSPRPKHRRDDQAKPVKSKK